MRGSSGQEVNEAFSRAAGAYGSLGVLAPYRVRIAVDGGGNDCWQVGWGTAHTLLNWARQRERHTDQREGLSTTEKQRIKSLEREVHELHRAKDILKLVSAFIEQVWRELGRGGTAFAHTAPLSSSCSSRACGLWCAKSGRASRHDTGCRRSPTSPMSPLSRALSTSPWSLSSKPVGSSAGGSAPRWEPTLSSTPWSRRFRRVAGNKITA